MINSLKSKFKLVSSQKKKAFIQQENNKYLPNKNASMNTKWNYKSWQKDFFNMKSYSSSDSKLLMGGVKGLKDAQRLVADYVEYERVR